MTVALALNPGVEAPARIAHAPCRVALLGCGTVGSAFAALAQLASPDRNVQITHALVRDGARARPTLRPDVVRIGDGRAVFAARPDVVVELLGGLEPARSLVIDALHRRIPVVTANKSLLARHGAELRALAARTGTPLLYEAAVIAGVPFLGTFARRPHAASITGLVGIANGTSNYLLTRARNERCGIGPALEDAQRLGLAEPDPSNDLDGIDAAEKLAVLLQHFGTFEVRTDDIETEGIRQIETVDLDQADALGGTIKPVIQADWSAGLSAFAGPAFVPSAHALATVDGADNALLLDGRHGRMLFRGPGAGPDVTAATIMDDVYEATRPASFCALPPLRRATPSPAETSWFIRLSAEQLPRSVEIADLLASHGVFLHRTHLSTGIGSESFAALTFGCARSRVQRALRALDAAAPCGATLFRALEAE
ncbi:MAG: homoserine dehydrogenase [Vicinamibacterales bacterium]